MKLVVLESCSLLFEQIVNGIKMYTPKEALTKLLVQLGIESDKKLIGLDGIEDWYELPNRIIHPWDNPNWIPMIKQATFYYNEDESLLLSDNGPIWEHNFGELHSVLGEAILKVCTNEQIDDCIERGVVRVKGSCKSDCDI
jgi:hypothetical protein